MKFSKSIVVFVFVLSVSSTFSWTMQKTKGDLLKSLQFTMYCLSIKFNLIGPNLVMALDQYQYQSSQEICRALPYYTSGYSNDYYNSSKLYMAKMESYVSYRSESIVKEVRGGGRLEDAALFLAMLYMLKYHAAGFQPVRPVVRPPHIQARNDLVFGKSFPNRFPSALEGKKRYRAEVKIDMDDQYQKFLLTKNPNTNCSKQRYKKLCVDQKTGIIDKQSIDEAEGLLEAKGLGLVIGGYRTSKDKIDADFGVEGPPPYDLADVKTLINWGKGNENLTVAAKRMGKKIVKQKERMQSYGKMPLHIVDLKKLDAHEKRDYKVTVINEIGNSKDIVFINDSNKN